MTIIAQLDNADAVRLWRKNGQEDPSLQRWKVHLGCRIRAVYDVRRILSDR